jgi:TPR repeat protein
MADRSADIRAHVERLRELLPGDDAVALHEASLAAEHALDDRPAEEGPADPVDPALVEELARLADEALGRSAGLGHPKASAEVAWRIYCAGQEDRAEEAYVLANQAAESADGQYLLGLFTFAGFGCPIDLDASLAHHRHAAEGGLPDAMFELYVYGSRGIGQPVDEVAAVEWCRRAAEAGSVRAMTNLGGFYATGRGVPHDPQLSLHWYEQAAELGHGRAAGTLGVMYAAGQGVEVDEELARRWLAIALSLGYDPTALLLQCELDPERLLGARPE